MANMHNSCVRANLSLALLFPLLAPCAWAANHGWDHVGDGGTPGTASLNGSVNALRTVGTDLYVGGTFTDAGGVASADAIAKWNGATWSGLAPLNGSVFAIAFAGGTLYVGGAFTDAGGNADADFLAAWNGSAWQPVCNGSGAALNADVFALQVIGNTLFVGGAFHNGAGIASADYLLACDLITGSAYSPVASDGGMTGPIYALTADASGTLYVGGAAINIDSNPAIDFVGAYDGTWHALGTGPGPGGASVNDIVRALVSDGTNVYIGTDALNIGGVPGANHVARWNGTWHAMGSNYFSTPTTINALAVDGSFVFAGGSFQNANGNARADALVYWNGATWNTFGSDGAGGGALNASTNALATLGTRIFAGGAFTSAGGDVLARFIAQAPIVLFSDGFD